MCPVVTIRNGTLRGTIEQDYKGNQYYSFKGIPYAKPPVGDLRFRPPQPAEPWEGTLDASKHGNNAPQRDPLRPPKQESEDCLYLNVYTKELSPTQLKPVLFWIHGGGFIWGSGDSDIYGPDYLMTENIVLVTFNYRLGLLGFLSFEDPSLGATGNGGLKDQTLALKWVQGNISSFGGDPNNVTIFGESAGAASVHYHVLSPLSKGLFHKAILQSGCALSSWASGRHISKEDWNKLGVEGDDPKKALEYFRSLPGESFLELFKKLDEGDFKAATKSPCAPVIESPNVEDAFITNDASDIIKSGNYNQVPLIVGTVSHEGHFFIGIRKMIDNGLAPEKLSNTSDNVPSLLNYPPNSEKYKSVADKMKQFYFSNKETSVEEAYSRLISDIIFIVPITSAIKHHLKTTQHPIYEYKLTLESELGWIKKVLKVGLPGVSHADDLGILFKSFESPEIKAGSIEDLTVQRVVRLWSNFAKYGNPTPHLDESLTTKWEPLTEEHRYLNIGEELKMGTNPHSESIQFWKNIFSEHPDFKDYL